MTAQTLPIHPLVISRGMMHHCWAKVGYTVNPYESQQMYSFTKQRALVLSIIYCSTTPHLKVMKENRNLIHIMISMSCRVIGSARRVSVCESSARGAGGAAHRARACQTRNTFACRVSGPEYFCAPRPAHARGHPYESRRLPYR